MGPKVVLRVGPRLGPRVGPRLGLHLDDDLVYIFNKIWLEFNCDKIT